MDTNVQLEAKRQKESLVNLLNNKIVDPNIRRYIFGDSDVKKVASSYRLFPEYIKNTLSLTFYFAYACYRYDIDYGEMHSERMTNNNAKRVIKSLKDAFVRYPATQELIQYVLTDIQFDLAQSDSELKDILCDLSDKDMNRFSFNPYFKLIAIYDNAPSRYQHESKVESLRLLEELLETLTFLQKYKLQQTGPDMFEFVCMNAGCEFESLPLNHIFYYNTNIIGGIYHLFSIENRSSSLSNSAQPTLLLRYCSGTNSLTFSIPDAEEDENSSHLIGQRPYEVYMEVTGCEKSLKSYADNKAKSSNSIEQIHTINYKYIKNLALAISDSISTNAGSKEALYGYFGRAYPYIFQNNAVRSQNMTDIDYKSLDWDTVVIMLLIEASPTVVLERLMMSVPQTFYDIVNNLYKRTDLTFFKAKKSQLDEEVQKIYDTKFVVGEAGGFGKITTLEPTRRLKARAQAMLIISKLSMLQESDRDKKLIYTGNLGNNIAHLQKMSVNEDNEKRVRHACIILGETLKHMMCFYSGLYKFGEKRAEFDLKMSDKYLSEDDITHAQRELERVFFEGAEAQAKALANELYELDRPNDVLKMFSNFIAFCDSAKNNSRYLYATVGKYEIIDKRVLVEQYEQLKSIVDDSYHHADIWIRVTLEILEYFKTGSYSDTAYDQDLLNAIYPFTAAFNRGKENPDGHRTVNFSLNIDVDSDNNTDFQADISVLSEFTYDRNEVYYCLPNIIRSNYKWWIDPVLINFRRFNDIFDNSRRDDG